MSGEIFLEVREVSVDEREGSVRINIVRTGDLSEAVTVDWEITEATVNGATLGRDYGEPAQGDEPREPLAGVVSFSEGQARATIIVPIIDDLIAEQTETFVVSITGLSGGTLGAPRTTRVAILDNENPQPVEIEPPLVSPYDVTLQPIISGVPLAIDFAFSPTDPSIMFVASKLGRITVHDAASGAQVGTLLDIADKVNSSQDRGLLDFVFHPKVPGEPYQPYLYVFYVVDPPETAGETGNAGPDGLGNRFSYVSRFTLDAASGYTTIEEGSEVVLVGGAGRSLADISGGGALDSSLTATANPASPDYVPPSDIDAATGLARQDYLKVDSSTHAGGALAFGPDGALYVSVGDGTAFNTVDPRTVTVQNLDALAGKILRIDPLTGRGLADNPFVTEGLDLDSNRAKVFQLGLRNPFSIGFDANGRLIITETGWNAWEEINVGAPGANFGWPWYEGGDGGVSLESPYRNLPEAQAFYAAVAAGDIVVTPAFRAFAHDPAEPGYKFIAITGGSDVYSGDVYPSSLDNHYFFSNLPGKQIFAVDVNDRRDLKFIAEVPGRFAPVHYAAGPDGYIYYVNIVSGEVGRLLIAPKAVDLKLSGAASYDGVSGEYLLTPDALRQTGIVMSQARVDLSRPATFDFELNFGDRDAGGDGIAFVLHADPRGASAAGTGGSGFGVLGLAKGLGVEFDTFANGPGTGDIAEDHLSFFATDGSWRSAPVALPNLEDGDWKRVVVRWEPVDGTLSVSIDGARIAELKVDLSAILGGAAGHFGFGGGTGGASNEQRLRLNVIDAVYDEGVPRVVRVEAENMEIVQGFAIASIKAASGGRVLAAVGSGEQIARTVFSGAAGIYDLSIGHFDENDAVASMRVLVNGVEVDRWSWDLDFGSANPNAATRTARIVEGLDLRTNDVIELRGFRAVGEPLRTDYLDFAYVESIPAFRIEAESFTFVQGLRSVDAKFASGGKYIQAVGSGEQIARTTFEARDGIYDLAVGHFDESDGVASMRVFVNDVEIDAWIWNGSEGSTNPNAQSLTERDIDGVALRRGDIIELRGFGASGEPMRTDYLDFAYRAKLSTSAPEASSIPEPFRVEAETFELVQGFTQAGNAAASGGFVIAAVDAAEQIARHVFGGPAGTYRLELGHFDESDGVASMRVLVNGDEIDAWDWNGTFGAAGPSAQSRATRVMENVALSIDDVIELRGFGRSGEPLRTDYLDFIWTGDPIA